MLDKSNWIISVGVLLGNAVLTCDRKSGDSQIGWKTLKSGSSLSCIKLSSLFAYEDSLSVIFSLLSISFILCSSFKGQN